MKPFGCTNIGTLLVAQNFWQNFFIENDAPTILRQKMLF